MTELNYTLHVRELAEELGMKPIEIARLGIAVNTAYSVWHGKDTVSLDTVWKIFCLMREQNILHPSGRTVKFSDLVTFPE